MPPSRPFGGLRGRSWPTAAPDRGREGEGGPAATAIGLGLPDGPAVRPATMLTGSTPEREWTVGIVSQPTARASQRVRHRVPGAPGGSKDDAMPHDPAQPAAERDGPLVDDVRARVAATNAQVQRTHRLRQSLQERGRSGPG